MELQVKHSGKSPDLSKLSKAAVLRIGDKAMRGYIDKTTKALEDRHNRPAGGTTARALARITGEGIDRLRAYEVRTEGDDVLGVVTLNQYMKSHEFGGVIKAAGDGYLTVPLPAALNADGTPKRWSARGWRGAFVIKSRRGNLVIVRQEGRKLVPLYVLRKSIKHRARLGLRVEMRKRRKELTGGVAKGIVALIKGRD